MVTEKNKIIAKAEEKRKYLTGEAERERLQELREKAEFDEATAYAVGKAKPILPYVNKSSISCYF